jgi:hypothetical protein
MRLSWLLHLRVIASFSGRILAVSDRLGSDAAYAVAIDSAGNIYMYIYIGGQTLSADFSLRGALQSTNPGNYAGLVANITTPTVSALAVVRVGICRHQDHLCAGHEPCWS